MCIDEYSLNENSKSPPIIFNDKNLCDESSSSNIITESSFFKDISGSDSDSSDKRVYVEDVKKTEYLCRG